jgi:hypothetical protein
LYRANLVKGIKKRGRPLTAKNFICFLFYFLCPGVVPKEGNAIAEGIETDDPQAHRCGFTPGNAWGRWPDFLPNPSKTSQFPYNEAE